MYSGVADEPELDEELCHVKHVEFAPSGILVAHPEAEEGLEAGDDEAHRNAEAVDEEDKAETGVDLVNAPTSQAMKPLHPLNPQLISSG